MPYLAAVRGTAAPTNAPPDERNSVATTVESLHPRTHRTVPLPVTIASWAVPVMIVGRFSLIAAVPVVIAVFGALRHVPDRTVRWAVTLLAGTYAVPLVVWLTRPDGARSLSEDMHPLSAGLIVAASAAVIVALHRTRRHHPSGR
ncbi:hypothetical protein ACIP88_00885 [Streptomyces uncialis]|uniref:hypothetical protein n=1 Tax=Streptomyces uncialis TaxID=1048205 RepID=UPI00381054CD